MIFSGVLFSSHVFSQQKTPPKIDKLSQLESELKSLIGEIEGIKWQHSNENLLLSGEIANPKDFRKYKKVIASYVAQNAPVMDFVELANEANTQIADDMQNDIEKTNDKEGVKVRSISQ